MKKIVNLILLFACVGVLHHTIGNMGVYVTSDGNAYMIESENDIVVLYGQIDGTQEYIVNWIELN